MPAASSRDLTASKALVNGVAAAAAAGDDSPLMSERTPNTPAPSVPDGKDSPNLRLAGTNAGPVTVEERELLDLRAMLVRTRAVQGGETALIRERLDRSGRRDPIVVATGVDAFTRATAELDTMLARIDTRLAEIDAARGVSIEIDPQAADLIRRS